MSRVKDVYGFHRIGDVRYRLVSYGRDQLMAQVEAFEHGDVEEFGPSAWVDKPEMTKQVHAELDAKLKVWGESKDGAS